MKSSQTLALAVLLAATSCATTATPLVVTIPDVSVTREAAAVHVDWKERLDQPYVFVERCGDYRNLGDAMRELMGLSRVSGVETMGAPFALFYDDPARVPVGQLRFRACLPIAGMGNAEASLGFDVLPRATVAYALVSGAYGEAGRAYPGLFSYLNERGWAPAGPIREVYLVDPGSVENWEELRTEVQIPWVFSAEPLEARANRRLP